MAMDPGRPHDAMADGTPAERLEDTNALLAEWAACSVEESEPLVERLEALGYEVRGKSREEVEVVLRKPPTRPKRG